MKSEPDDNTKRLMDILSEENESTVFPLHEEGADYEKLVDLIFENDKVISWW
jgi:hypothetical protein